MFRWRANPSYFIEGHLDDIPKLIAAGIKVSEASIKSPRSVNGISFPIEEREKVISLIGMSGYIRESETDKAYLTLLHSGRSICLDTDNISGVRSIDTVIDEYAKEWGMDIAYMNPHGHPYTLRKEENDPHTLYLFFWSVPQETPSRKYRHVFGYELGDGQSDGFAPSVEGEFLYDADIPVAQIVGNILYVLFDLPHGTSYSVELLRCVLNAWGDYRAPKPEILTEEARKAAMIRACESYIQIGLKRAQVELTNLTNEIQANTEKIQSAQELITVCVRSSEIAEKRLAIVKEQIPCQEQLFRDGYHKLFSNPKIEFVDVRSHVLIVTTVHLVTSPLRKDNSIRDLGVYDIKVHVMNGRISVRNQTRTVDDLAHPYAYAGGSLSMGNLEAEVSKLIGQFSFEQLFTLLIRFLENPNEKEAAGQRIYSWPLLEGKVV